MIYDISQPLFECSVYPGDPGPVRTVLSRMEDGALYNLTAFSMCAHNGTHVDAPYHFIREGKGIDRVSLDRFIGPACVVTMAGDISAEDAHDILSRARVQDPEAAKRILIRGRATVTLDAARVFADAGLYLIGNESQTVGPEDGPMAVHLALLSREVVLLEGIRLGEVPDGVYTLYAAPLNLTGADGAPCRAVLVTDN